MINHIKKISISYLIILAITLFCIGCSKDNRASSIELAKTEGTVNVWDEKKDMELIENMKLYDGYHVGTKKAGYAWVLLDSVKIAKLDVLSEIEIEKSGKDLEILLNSGSIFFHVTEPLKEDETMNICTSSMAVGIRGTCGWVEISDENHMKVCILEGRVECEMNNPASPENKTVSVSAGESVVITIENGKATVKITQMTEADIPSFVMEELEKNKTVLEEARQFLAPKATSEDAAAAYQNYIDTVLSGKSFFEGEDSSLINEGTGYELIYLNDDEIPECLIWEKQILPDGTVSSYYSRLSLLSFIDGNVQEFASSGYGSGGLVFSYAPRNGRFYTEEYLGLRNATFWQIGELTDTFQITGTADQDSFWGNDGTQESFWDINGEQASSREELDEYLNSFGCEEMFNGDNAYRSLQEAYEALE